MLKEPRRELEVAGVPLATMASIYAGLAETFTLEDVLENEGVEAQRWPAISRAWMERIADDADEGGTLAVELDLVMMEAQERYERRLPPLDEDVAAWVDFMRLWGIEPDPMERLEALGMRAGDITRLQRLWNRRIAADEATKKQVDELYKSEPGALPAVHPEPAKLPPAKPRASDREAHPPSPEASGVAAPSADMTPTDAPAEADAGDEAPPLFVALPGRTDRGAAAGHAPIAAAAVAAPPAPPSRPWAPPAPAPFDGAPPSRPWAAPAAPSAHSAADPAGWTGAPASAAPTGAPPLETVVGTMSPFAAGAPLPFRVADAAPQSARAAPVERQALAPPTAAPARADAGAPSIKRAPDVGAKPDVETVLGVISPFAAGTPLPFRAADAAPQSVRAAPAHAPASAPVAAGSERGATPMKSPPASTPGAAPSSGPETVLGAMSPFAAGAPLPFRAADAAPPSARAGRADASAFPPVPPSAPDASPPSSRLPRDLGATLDVAVSPFHGMKMPFQEAQPSSPPQAFSSVAPPVPSSGPPASQRGPALDAPTIGLMSPFQAQAPMPFKGAAPAKSMTIGGYASLCAELAAAPRDAEAIFARHGLADVAARKAVDATLRARLQSDPAAKRQFDELYWHRLRALEKAR